MGEINKIEKMINERGDEKLRRYIKETPFYKLDGMNTHILIPDKFGYICDSGDNKGKTMVRLDAIQKLIEESVFKKLQADYRSQERTKFLNEIEMIRSYVIN